MTNFKDHKVSERTKLLLVGDSGSGKTAALASLAKAGYELYIFDFDNGLDILANYLTSEEASRVHYQTLKDVMGKRPEAYEKFRNILQNGWPDDSNQNRIKMNELPSNSIIIIDSLTFLGDCLINHFETLNPGTKDPRQHYGNAAEIMEDVINYFTGETVGNFIATAHIRYIEDASGISRAYPTCVGRTLPTHIARYFNNVLRADVKSNGKLRVLRTISDTRMDLKNTAPSLITVEEELDPTKADSGLTNIIKKIQQNAKERYNS